MQALALHQSISMGTLKLDLALLISHSAHATGFLAWRIGVGGSPVPIARVRGIISLTPCVRALLAGVSRAFAQSKPSCQLPGIWALSKVALRLVCTGISSSRLEKVVGSIPTVSNFFPECLSSPFACALLCGDPSCADPS